MIRAESKSGWKLVTHPDHARVAGLAAESWGNERFARPEPISSILYALNHHDDGWLARDASPVLTLDGKPEAFTRTLVGGYAAFEEIDLPSYLQVRGAATAAVAQVDPVAGVIVSMHTVNLLTEQANLDSIRPDHREAHRVFVDAQRAWQQQTAAALGLAADTLQRGFEFLQVCDNLSLIVCADYRDPVTLRHSHPDRSGNRMTIGCRGGNGSSWQIDPWPFADRTVTLEVPFREVDRSACAHVTIFRSAFAAAPLEHRVVTLKHV